MFRELEFSSLTEWFCAHFMSMGLDFVDSHLGCQLCLGAHLQFNFCATFQTNFVMPRCKYGYLSFIDKYNSN